MASSPRSSPTDSAKHQSSPTRITRREKGEFLSLFRKILEAIPDDGSCHTCTHYSDGRCDQSGGQVIPDDIKPVGCEMRQDSVGTVFG